MKTINFLLLSVLVTIFSCGKTDVIGTDQAKSCYLVSNYLSWPALTDPDGDLGGFYIYKYIGEEEGELIAKVDDSLAGDFDLRSTTINACGANYLYMKSFTLHTQDVGVLGEDGYIEAGTIKNLTDRSNYICWGMDCPK